MSIVPYVMLNVMANSKGQIIFDYITRRKKSCIFNIQIQGSRSFSPRSNSNCLGKSPVLYILKKFSWNARKLDITTGYLFIYNACQVATF